MTVKVAGIVHDSIVDGPGLRLSVFFQGCPHRCPGCHNPGTWDFSGGTDTDLRDIISLFGDPLLGGVTLTGGEPLAQEDAAYELARAAKERGLNVWVYTGYDYADVKDSKLLTVTDTLVDGKFILAERDLDLPWRGSRNQNIIHLGGNT